MCAARFITRLDVPYDEVSGESAASDDAAFETTVSKDELDASADDLSPEALVAQRRAHRLLSMSLLQLTAAVGALLSFRAPWYRVTLEAPQVVGSDGVIHTLPSITAQANAFAVIAAGSVSPYCPAVPHAAGWPIPVLAVLAATLLAVLAAWLRSPLLAGASLFAGIQAFRHLSVLHAAVLGGPAGCMVGDVEVTAARAFATIGVSAVLLLSGLLLWQIMQVRTSERKAKLARGETVPPTLLEMVQTRVIGVAGAVVAEAQRR